MRRPNKERPVIRQPDGLRRDASSARVSIERIGNSRVEA